MEAGVSPATSKTSAATTVLPFSTGWHCAYCDLDIRPPTPGLFSFNNPLGACPECRGFGRTITIDLNKAIPDRTLTYQTRRGAGFSRRGVWRIAKRFASRLCARGGRHQCSVRGIAQGRPGFCYRGGKAIRRLHRRRLRRRPVVRRPRLFSLAREQNVQDACARPAQSVSRLHHVSEV